MRNRVPDALHFHSIDAERLLQNCTWNASFKHLIRCREESRVLRGEVVKCDCRFVANIELEMLSSFGEDSEIPNLQGGGIQHVVVADEARVDRSFYNQQCLRCERVGVQWEHSTDSEVETDVRDAQSVEPW